MQNEQTHIKIYHQKHATSAHKVTKNWTMSNNDHGIWSPCDCHYTGFNRAISRANFERLFVILEWGMAVTWWRSYVAWILKIITCCKELGKSYYYHKHVSSCCWIGFREMIVSKEHPVKWASIVIHILCYSNHFIKSSAKEQNVAILRKR